jgi:ribosomal protein S18 acetylase RimI-like enzyme
VHRRGWGFAHAVHIHMMYTCPPPGEGNALLNCLEQMYSRYADTPTFVHNWHADASQMLQDKVYREMVQCGDVSQLAILQNKCIGAIGCRLEMKRDGNARLHILTLGVLAPFRNHGIGTYVLLRACINRV